MRRRLKKKELVLKKAKEILAKRGIISTNIADIAKKLKITRTAIYYYFESKDEIVKTIIIEGISKFFRILNEKIENISTSKDVFKVILETFVWTLKNDKNFLAIYFQIFSAQGEFKLKKYREIFIKERERHYKDFRRKIADKGIIIDNEDYNIIVVFFNGMVLSEIAGISPEKFIKVGEMFMEFVLERKKEKKDT